ncbi:MAG: Ribosomal RNA small subunit methyltransferase H [Acidimicrobiales bacterium]|nr:MAG: 16S rRNA (cytosine(1402)-N(4))-methyltransferase RsmH [Actinomycetota bacterium]MBV6508758.1 Ribosomal RNA small subunit methyltransferase H [Acidimicrobiales bacterium]RIK06639.1 MAG: 16S rRNA (cytosine(1402)-N(4))-methyltransferase [Acidobacteriota bacterium]
MEGEAVWQHHEPVMMARVVELFRVVPAGLFVDATLGGGGHARSVLQARPDLRLLGIDRDEEAVEAARAALDDMAGRVVLRRGRFDQLAEFVDELGEDLAGVLFDLGVSSTQLDRPDRGFSYRLDAPLDMRMDRRQRKTAGDVVNSYQVDQLEELISRYGDERYSRPIARAIVTARPVTSTGELAEIVKNAIPAAARRRGGHPAKRTFQAIRIEVNDELDALVDALDQAIDLLLPGGRCAVLSYHSGEDRIVKQRFRLAAGLDRDLPVMPAPADEASALVRLIKRGAWTAGSEEIEANPRSRSARLRAVEKAEVAAS